MVIVAMLLILSAFLGFATGLRFKVLAVALLSVLIVLSSAIVLVVFGFGLKNGTLAIVACLVVSQISYVVGAALRAARQLKKK
jgi:hypothetical protein